MNSPRLEAMAKRAALPIRVLWDDFYSNFEIQWPIDGGPLKMVDCPVRPEDATAAYFDLVSTLESAAPSSADTAAADPASFSPEDAL